MDDQYVVTGFDENYWQKWGISWIASLIEVAKFQGNILVVDFGLSIATKRKLAELGAFCLPGSGNFRVGTLNAIADFAAKYPGIFAVWDADVYFQSNIDEIFTLAKEQVVTTNRLGFYATPSSQFADIKECQDLVTFIQGPHQFCFNYLHALPDVKTLEDTWNFTEVANLLDQNGVLTYEDKVQKVIHPSGHIKAFLVGENIAFWDRYKEIYNKHCDVKQLNFKLI